MGPRICSLPFLRRLPCIVFFLPSCLPHRSSLSAGSIFLQPVLKEFHQAHGPRPVGLALATIAAPGTIASPVKGGLSAHYSRESTRLLCRRQHGHRKSRPSA